MRNLNETFNNLNKINEEIFGTKMNFYHRSEENYKEELKKRIEKYPEKSDYILWNEMHNGYPVV